MATSLLCAALAAAEDVSPAAGRLAQYDLEPTAESLAAYLASLQPTADRRQHLQNLINQLGDSQFARREEASRQLLRQVGGVTPLLAEAVAGDNPEIRWRAKVILEQTDRESRALLAAVLTVIDERNVAGLSPGLFAIVPLCDDDHLRQQLRRALAATATPADEGLLRQQLAAADPQARLAAIATLAAVLGSDADVDALRLLTDESENVQAAAARELANHGRRESLPVLVRLLESSEVSTRSRAIQTLRAFTGKRFDYSVYAPPQQRSKAVAAWKQWLASEGMTASLMFPLREVAIDLGRLMVCDHGQNLLVEFDTTGKEIWKTNVGVQPWACIGLPSGHRLVGSYNERTVVEYDAKGDEVWRVGNIPGGPTSVERLENGNTLIACTEGDRVIEIDPAKKTVWQVEIAGRPVDARRLPDGRTLVALQNANKIVELDNQGKQVWEITGVGQAFSAQRLENGNTLVSSIGHNKVREFDRAGRVVWERGAFNNPYSAQRLASGNTIVVDAAGVTEIDLQGTVVSRIQRPSLSRAWRY